MNLEAKELREREAALLEREIELVERELALILQTVSPPPAPNKRTHKRNVKKSWKYPKISSPSGKKCLRSTFAATVVE